MKLVLVHNGEYTAAYHDFYKNKIGVYKTSDGVDGLMELIGVRITKDIFCSDAKKGHLVDAVDGFPYHLDNLPTAEKTVVHKEPKKQVEPVEPVEPPPSRKSTKKSNDNLKKSNRKVRRPTKRK